MIEIDYNSIRTRPRTYSSTYNPRYGWGNELFDDESRRRSTSDRAHSVAYSIAQSLNGGWDEPTEMENPQNWPLWKKIFHTAIPAFYGFVLTVGTSAYVPAVSWIMFTYNVNREIALLPLALYTLGFTIGPLIYAPMSELYGRRIAYWISMPLLLIFIATAGASKSVPLLIISRFFASLTGSGALAVGAGTILDIWSRKAQGLAALSYILAPFLGPTLGPIIGANIISEYGNDWRWSMWIVLLIAAPIAILSVFMKETSKSRILYLRAKDGRRKMPRQSGDTRLFLLKLQQAFRRPLHMMFCEPLVAFLSIYTGFAFAVMFSFFASYNYVFLVVYHFDEKKIGFCFLGILIGFVFAILSFGIFDHTLYAQACRRHNGEPPPEERLYTAMLGSIMLPIGLFWFAWTPRPEIPWIVPAMAGIPFGWGTLAIFISATAYLVDVYQAVNSASAIAANGILRYTLGAAFPLFTVQLYMALGIQWAGSVFAFLSVLLMPVPWIFYWQGRWLRAKSSYDTSRL